MGDYAAKERRIDIKVKEIPLSERPYEKLEMYGESFLSNAELLAIIIGSGTRNETSIALAQRVLNFDEISSGKIRNLMSISLEDLKRIKGIGRVKAIRIKALCEFAKRLERPNNNDIIIKSSRDAANLVMAEMRYEKKEYVKLIILNTKNKVLKIENISLGSTNYAIVEPRDILSIALKYCADKIILVHNHPSGNPTPSLEDISVTKRLKSCAEMIGIELLDHIVIGDGVYQSIKVSD